MVQKTPRLRIPTPPFTPNTIKDKILEYLKNNIGTAREIATKLNFNLTTVKDILMNSTNKYGETKIVGRTAKGTYIYTAIGRVVDEKEILRYPPAKKEIKMLKWE